MAVAAAVAAATATLAGCSSGPGRDLGTGEAVPSPGPVAEPADPPTTPAASALQAGRYPWHTDVLSRTFWVGEVSDPDASDGSRVLSTYDSGWESHYGGCDGVVRAGVCHTQRRTSADGWFPTAMTPLENPFYLDLPFDDVNDAAAFARRDAVIPWAHEAPYAEHVGDRDFSDMKNRWVELRSASTDCFGQIEDAGPGQDDDAAYVFGEDDARPANHRYGGAGLDVSPALNGCLGHRKIDGDTDRVSWRFVDDGDVPGGPWTQIVTTSQVR